MLCKLLIQCNLEAQKSVFFKDKWAPYLDSLKPLGLRCCVISVIRRDVGGGTGEGKHFSQSKNARLLNFNYDIGCMFG